MSYVKIELPDYLVLKKELLKNPDSIMYYMKYEGFGGDVKSVQFLNQKIEEFKKSKVKAWTLSK